MTPLKLVVLTSFRSTEAIFVAVARSIFIVFVNLETFEWIQLGGFCYLLIDKNVLDSNNSIYLYQTDWINNLVYFLPLTHCSYTPLVLNG